MKVRGLTVFAEPDADAELLARFAAALTEALPLEVQSKRLALSPFPGWLPAGDAAKLDAILERWSAAGFEFVAIGPVLLRHDADRIDELPALMSHPARPFAAVEIADEDGVVDPDRCWRLAEATQAVAGSSDDGFSGMFLTALAGCRPGTPFFPAGWHGGGAARFAIALETGALAAELAAEAAGDPAHGMERLSAGVTEAAARVTPACERLAREFDVAFEGIDFSLAPYPGDATSIGGAMRSLTGAAPGDAGSVFAAGLLAASVQQADFPRCGFSGLMLPVLEDSVLGERSSHGLLGIHDLLLMSAVCGTGLDTIPLPGDVSVDQLAAIYLDVATLAGRLGKPLTARLMPIPGAIPGDPVEFGMEYFAAGAVLPVPGRGIPRPRGKDRLRIPRFR